MKSWFRLDDDEDEDEKDDDDEEDEEEEEVKEDEEEEDVQSAPHQPPDNKAKRPLLDRHARTSLLDPNHPPLSWPKGSQAHEQEKQVQSGWPRSCPNNPRNPRHPGKTTTSAPTPKLELARGGGRHGVGGRG
ncbi:hypothetical protein C0Q70_17995 [Pomacea canaliculata]|uniref:Uncharacterized protein n=1 Tax=Pomacea canaliculata TaxID=400727 RepID=A0A2T7NLZ3_POMCA|nr:hypothetical protein C0Q70_17995 [Pomacea canaliculata]